MRTLHVSLGARSYPVYIGSKLLSSVGMLDLHVRASQVLIVSNETIAPLYLKQVLQLFANFDCKYEILPDGEQFKTVDTVSRIYDRLLKEKFSRSATLVALGGGVIGDMTGFAAACYQRGIAFIQIPTTLLSQVDSSVGGKTGVNHPLGKNMIGAFHQPACVLIDTDTLSTLPDREFSAGLAEVVKYGLIGDSDFLEWLEENLELLLFRDSDALAYAVECSCRNKADIVAADEMETGVRALLNFGHTFGHAIESWQKYQGLLHGEAVAVGMVMAAELSNLLGYLHATDVRRIRTILERCHLPVEAPVGMSNDAFIDLMQRDKKVMDGRLRFILLEAMGKAVIDDCVMPEMIETALGRCRKD